MIKRTVAVSILVFFNLVAAGLYGAIFRNVFFVWVNNTRAEVGFWFLVLAPPAYAVTCWHLWRTRNEELPALEDAHG